MTRVAARLAMSAFSCVLALASSGCAHRVRLEPYAGTWVLHDQDQRLMTLTLQARRGHLHGELTLPEMFTEVASGHFEGVAPQQKTIPVSSRVTKRKVTLLAGFDHERDPLEVTQITPDHLSLRWANGHVPDWVFERGAPH